MSAPTRPERKPIGVCPVCREPALEVETDTAKIDVPPYSPDAPQVITSIPGPAFRVYRPCGHREDL